MLVYVKDTRRKDLLCLSGLTRQKRVIIKSLTSSAHGKTETRTIGAENIVIKLLSAICFGIAAIWYDFDGTRGVNK